ncbi:MAG: hypothetical protein AB1486_21865 [Planctomycetota bacterium]
MSLAAAAKKLKDGVRGATIPRIIATLAGGSLGQRTVLVLGLGLFAYGLYEVIARTVLPLILVTVGAVLVWLAMKDYDRTSSQPRDSTDPTNRS